MSVTFLQRSKSHKEEEAITDAHKASDFDTREGRLHPDLTFN